MRELTLAFGKSCYATEWSNKRTGFDWLCEWLRKPVRTQETVEQYKNFSKEERDRAKDQGGFVGGYLNGNKRRAENVRFRSMLTLDADNAEKSFIKRFTANCCYAAALYTTHSHTPDAPRVRIIVPLSRDVSSDEFIAISRYFAADWGIEQFDECSFRPAQLMYRPSVCSDGEFIFRKIDGEWLDPDRYLAVHPDWTQCAALPTSKHETASVTSEKRTLSDPTKKDGIVGTFCRAYPIREAIETFLPTVYSPSAHTGRYDYIPADSSAGVVIYDEKFAYSHHATDPAYGRLLNAFDIVRIHLFGDEDKKKSFDNMCLFICEDERVKRQLTQDLKETSQSISPASTNTDTPDTADKSSDEDIDKIAFNKNGGIKETLDNIVLVIRSDKGLKNIAYNLHRDSIEARGALPWKQIKPGWSDSDSASLKVYLSNKYGFYSPNKTRDALLAVASERAYHPVREYLCSLPEWDGTKRVETLLIDYFGAEDSVYTRAVTRKTLAAAVARIFEPGKKFDSVLILNGPQGIGKSTFFSRLAGDWFSDSLTVTDMKDKAGAEKLQGYWILELSELNGMKKTDVEIVKSFITRCDDKYRASYGVNVESHPRQSIIVGSTNAEEGFLRDITGNRRFWPVRISGQSEKKPWDIDTPTVRQIWAEALEIYRKGEVLYLTGDEATAAQSEQTKALESDEREGLVRRYLETLLPDEWDSMTLAERRNFLTDSEYDFNRHKGKNKRRTVSNIEIWCECFGRNAAEMRSADSYTISAIMKKIDGWEKDTLIRQIIPLYGRQRLYISSDCEED